MKKFLVKVFLFLFPFLIMVTFSFSLYNPNSGDLLRLGFIPDIHPEYRNIFSEEFTNQIYFNRVSKVKDYDQYKILTIGDSFSEQNEYGYNNYIAKSCNGCLLHVDRNLHVNPIEMVYSLINSSFFDNTKFEFVILQVVERDVNNRIHLLDKSNSRTLKQRIDSISTMKIDQDEQQFSTKSMLKFSLYNFYSLFDDHSFFSRVYRLKTKDDLFSINSDMLYILDDDLINTPMNNEMETAEKLNTIINELSSYFNSKNIELVFMVSPDKYDFYYNSVVYNTRYPKPIFFENFDLQEKNYRYVDIKNLLGQQTEKDVYFFDDTHWSPFASKIVARKIEEIISN